MTIHSTSVQNINMRNRTDISRYDHNDNLNNTTQFDTITKANPALFGTVQQEVGLGIIFVVDRNYWSLSRHA